MQSLNDRFFTLLWVRDLVNPKFNQWHINVITLLYSYYVSLSDLLTTAIKQLFVCE